MALSYPSTYSIPELRPIPGREYILDALHPNMNITDTEFLEDEDGIRYYRNAKTGQFELLDSGNYRKYNPLPLLKKVKKSYPINGIPSINDILGNVLSKGESLPVPLVMSPIPNTPLPRTPIPRSDISYMSAPVINYPIDSDANKPLPPMSMDPSMSADADEIPSGKVVVGPDTEVSAQPTQSVNKPTVVSAVNPKRVSKAKPYVKPVVSTNKPTVVNNTPVTPVAPSSNISASVPVPTLSSVTQAVRHNGGFDNYRRQSVLSALRAAGGISPAEAVQRGIIPMEALNYI